MASPDVQMSMSTEEVEDVGSDPETGKEDSAKDEGSGDSDDPRKKIDPKAPKKYKAWDKEEMLLLRKGVQRHGVGAWETIRQDPDFALLKLRTGVQIKDKWRNLVKFRHLTEEEKEAVASRTNKLNRRSAIRSSSFTFGGVTPLRKQTSMDLCWSQGQNLAQTAQFSLGALGGMSDLGDDNQIKRLQGLQAYSKAQQDRLQAEADVRQAQAGYDQASMQLNDAVTMSQQSQMGGNRAVENMVALANQAMRHLVLCKHRLSLARDIETRLMRTLQFHPSFQVPTSTHSMPSSPVSSVPTSPERNPLGNSMLGRSSQNSIPSTLQMRPNAAVMYGRSQSYDSTSFSRLYNSDDLLGNNDPSGEQPVKVEDNSVQLSCATAPGGPPMLMVRTSCGTRSPRKNSGSMPGSPLGRLRGNGPGRMSPLVRSFNMYESDRPDSAMSQLTSHFDMQMGQGNTMSAFDANGVSRMQAGSLSDSKTGGQGGISPVVAQGSSNTDIPDYGSSAYFKPSSVQLSSLPHTAPGGHSANPFFSSIGSRSSSSQQGGLSDSGLPGEVSSKRRQPFGISNDQGNFQGMFSNQQTQQTPSMGMPMLKQEDTSSGWQLPLQGFGNSDQADVSAILGNNCSDALLDCMEEIMNCDTLTEPQPLCDPGDILIGSSLLDNLGAMQPC